MVCSVVLQSLPDSFASFVAVFKFSHESKDLERGLLIFDSDSCPGQTDQGTSSQITKDFKSFKYGKIGHQQSECRAKVKKTTRQICASKRKKGRKQ